MNKPLLRKVKEAILAEPRKFHMGFWFEEDPESPCGTTACIAGHAIAIGFGAKNLKEAQQISWPRPDSQAAELLKIGQDQKDLLFFMVKWPEEFRDRYKAAYGGSSSPSQSSRRPHRPLHGHRGMNRNWPSYLAVAAFCAGFWLLLGWAVWRVMR